MLHFFTYSTSEEKFRFLKASAQMHNVPLQNLCTTSKWNGFQDRVDTLKHKLQDLPDTDIVCFLDAYDILINTDVETILETFKNANTDILYGAEVNLFPSSIEYLRESYPNSATQFRFLNNGCYIGYVHALKKLWAETPSSDDQENANLYFIKNQSTIKLDTNAKLVLNMASIPWNDIEIINGLVYYVPFGDAPCFIHFNGMSYLDKDTDIIQLENGQQGFDYSHPYSKTFDAILSSKMQSHRFAVVCKLTGQGHTY